MLVEVHIIEPDGGRGALLARRLRKLATRVELHEDASRLDLDQAAPGRALLAALAAAPDLLERLGNDEFGWPMIVYGERPAIREVVHAIESGALDFLEWPLGNKQLASALERAADNGDPKLAQLRKRVHAKKSVGLLSPREHQILSAVVAGHASKQIARDLGISPRTVEIHRRNVLFKLNAGSSAGAVRVGVHAGLDGRLDTDI